MQHASITVHGTVQGVGFRYIVRIAATRLGITGHVKNLDDGSVEIECEGEEERIDELVDIIKGSRKPIHVEDVKIRRADAEGKFATFRIIMGDLTSEMVEGFSTGTMYLERIDSKQDQMLDKQDQTIKEIRTLSSSMHDMLDARFQKLENEISHIKTKMNI